MNIIYKAAIFIHIISAIFWIGGMLFTAAVLAPASRHKMLKPSKNALFSIAGKKFSRISWVLFVILILTGILLLWSRGFGWHILTEKEFWDSAFGQTLYIKLHFFALILIISGLHDFWLGPKASSYMQPSSTKIKTSPYRKAARWVGRINLILGLCVLYYAITLVRG